MGSWPKFDGYLTIGSTREETFALLGPPPGVSRYPALAEEVWRYGSSTITFKNGRLSEWQQFARTLRIRLGFRTAAAENVRFGVTPVAVVQALGTPTGVSRYPALAEEVWRYGSSTITFKNGRVSGWQQLGVDLRIGAGPNGRFIDEPLPGESYLFNGRSFSADAEEQLYGVEVERGPSGSVRPTSRPGTGRQSLHAPLVEGLLIRESYPACAENGSCYGEISNHTGRPKTIHVDGYFRRDGTYVKGHYRSAPRAR